MAGKGEIHPARKQVSQQFPVSAGIIALQPGETYYYRVVAENGISETPHNANKGKPVDGKIEEFTTYAAPAATTGEAQNITGTAATLSGAVDPEGTETSYYFQYISEAGYQAALAKGAANPYAEGETTAPVSAGSGESARRSARSRPAACCPEKPITTVLVATNKYGVQDFGHDQTFTTGSALPPAVSTGGASGVSQNSATLSGTVTTNGLQTNYGFEIGTAPGDLWSRDRPRRDRRRHDRRSKRDAGRTAARHDVLLPRDGDERRRHRNRANPCRSRRPVSRPCSRPASPPLIAIPSIAFPTEEKSSGTTTKTLTNKEKLAKALKVCRRDRSKRKRTKCEKRARGKRDVAKKKK